MYEWNVARRGQNHGIFRIPVFCLLNISGLLYHWSGTSAQRQCFCVSVNSGTHLTCLNGISVLKSIMSECERASHENVWGKPFNGWSQGQMFHSILALSHIKREMQWWLYLHCALYHLYNDSLPSTELNCPMNPQMRKCISHWLTGFWSTSEKSLCEKCPSPFWC